MEKKIFLRQESAVPGGNPPCYKGLVTAHNRVLFVFIAALLLALLLAFKICH